jgi:phosphoserine phosphatase
VSFPSDLTIAREIQRNVLLRKLPRCPGYSPDSPSRKSSSAGSDSCTFGEFSARQQ